MTTPDDVRIAALEAQVETLGTALTTTVEHLTHIVRRVSVLEQAAHMHADVDAEALSGWDAEADALKDGQAGPSLTPAGPSPSSQPE